MFKGWFMSHCERDCTTSGGKTSEQVGDLMRECMKEIPSTQVEFFVSRGLIRFKAGSILIVTTDQVPQSTSGNEFHKGYGHIDNQTRHLIRL